MSVASNPKPMISMTDPQPSGGFEWVQAPWGRVLRCRPLASLADHFFTDGSLALRERQDEWEQVAGFAGVPAQRLLLLHQVHGRAVVVAEPDRSGDWNRPEADAVITADPSAALVVRVADCAPILLADRLTGAVAAVHAGWRSTMQRIVAAAIVSMRSEFGTDPANLVAAMGPCLGPCCGEMGDEVVTAFSDAGHSSDDIRRWFVRRPGERPHFDLWAANRDQLTREGVAPENIHVAALCTKTHGATFHSYRAAGTAAGRMAAVIRRRQMAVEHR